MSDRDAARGRRQYRERFGQERVSASGEECRAQVWAADLTELVAWQAVAHVTDRAQLTVWHWRATCSSGVGMRSA
jgi:hypothetical protein